MEQPLGAVAITRGQTNCQDRKIPRVDSLLVPRLTPIRTVFIPRLREPGAARPRPTCGWLGGISGSQVGDAGGQAEALGLEVDVLAAVGGGQQYRHGDIFTPITACVGSEHDRPLSRVSWPLQLVN